MGNVNTTELRREHRISSIENLKQLPYDTQHSRKKRSFFFPTATWKRFVESTKKKGSKASKINPSSYPEGGYQTQKTNPPDIRRGVSVGKEGTKNTPPQYAIKSRSQTGLKNGSIDTKPVSQQPRLAVTRISHQNENQSPSKHENTYKSLPSQQQVRLAATNVNSRNLSRVDPPQKSAQAMHTARAIANDNSKPATQTAPKPTQNVAPPRKVVIQASTAELLECLGEFICRRCRRVQDLEPIDVITWIRGVDRALLMQGWQDITFIMPSSVCFVYMLCREMVPESVTSVFEVQCIVLTCLYMSYSYMGNEISYPLRPFLIEPERYGFWSRCCKIIHKLSGKMLRINNDAQFFTTVFRDLKAYSPRRNTTSAPAYHHQNKMVTQHVSTAITVGGTTR